MSLLLFADCARLLGIHPKTLRQWIKLDVLEVRAHPKDARVKCLTLAQVTHLADLHDRQLSQEMSSSSVIPEGELPRNSNQANPFMNEGERLKTARLSPYLPERSGNVSVKTFTDL